MRTIRYTLITFLLLLVGCSPKATPTPTPQEIITSAAEHLRTQAGFQYSIDISGAPVYLDSTNSIGLSHVEGNFVAPNMANGTVKVSAMGMTTEVKIVGIGSDFWQTNPLSGQWGKSSGGFSPAVLFDAKVGLQKILNEDLSSVEKTGSEELTEMPGKPLDTFTAKVNGENIAKLTSGLIDASEMDIKLWIDPASNDLYRLQLIVPVKDSSETTTWQIDIWDMGKTVEITPPA